MPGTDAAAPQPRVTHPVVVIGASAGGLEAMLSLLPRLQATGRARIIVAQHMSRSAHTDLVVRVLGRKAGMPVVEAADGVLVLPDTVYVVPAGRDAVFEDGRIRLREPQAEHLSTPSVDLLFASVARSVGAQAVAIVLSGAGSDGVRGCRAIRAHGGTVIVQGEESTSIHGMAGAVQREGLAHLVLTPDGIADHINHLMPSAPVVGTFTQQHPYTGAPQLRVLLERMSERSGVDFTMYRQGTLLRRMDRRRETLRLPDLDAYVARALDDPEELDALQRLFLISWSWFYRDAQAWDRLREELRALLAAKPAGEAFTAWVPGCATGEECYTIAMLVRELDPQREVRVIGSDFSVAALTAARAALYKATALREMPAYYRQRYFIASTDGLRVTDEIRDSCIFREEDVLTSHPAERFDLVSCRNLLIYMKRELHETLLGTIHDRLRPSGLLFLGLSEGMGREEATRFTTVDSALRIYRRRTPA